MRRIFLSIVLILAITIVIFSATNAFAEENETHANSSTSFSGNNIGSVLKGDSTTSGYGNYAKITLYLATTNDTNEISFNIDGTIDMTKTPVTRSDGQPMFVKFGKSILDESDANNVYCLSTPTYSNLATCKVDTLLDNKKGEKYFPIYDNSTKTTDVDLTHVGLPEWLTPTDKTNQPAVVDYFTGDNNSEIACNNLVNIMKNVAEQSDPSSAIAKSAVNNVLKTTLNKASFKYRDSSGTDIQLSIANVLPTNEHYYAYWLIVYEPVINYHQDPNKMFFPTAGGSSFLITVSDAVLQNMHSGANGYPSVVKFMQGTPSLVMSYNHCNLCGLTWYGYPTWTNSKLPLARYCPLPCLGVAKDYVGVQTKTRWPFIMPPIAAAAKNFTIQTSWMPYNNGYLFIKPTESPDSMFNSVTRGKVDDYIQFGGYSLFVNGPVNEASKGRIRTVMIDEQGRFADIPKTTVTITDANDPTFRKTLEMNSFGNAIIDDITELNNRVLQFSVGKPSTPQPIKTYIMFAAIAKDYCCRTS